jgi:hypothetical protein
LAAAKLDPAFAFGGAAVYRCDKELVSSDGFNRSASESETFNQSASTGAPCLPHVQTWDPARSHGRALSINCHPDPERGRRGRTRFCPPNCRVAGWPVPCVFCKGRDTTSTARVRFRLCFEEAWLHSCGKARSCTSFWVAQRFTAAIRS